jgi:hypothetical protein
MKKKLLSAILGLSVVPGAFGQGHILLNNYTVPPYNQVYWHPSTPAVGNQAVRADQGVTLTIWYGEGIITDPSLLIQGPDFGILEYGGSELYDPGAGHGPGGYYLAYGFMLNTWQPGDTFTFQIRASGLTTVGVVDPLLSRSVLWQENAAIRHYSLPAETTTLSVGLAVVVPEPTSLALAGVAFGSLLIVRRSGHRGRNLS